MRSFLPFDRHALVSVVAFVLVQRRPVLAFTQCYYPDGSIPTDYVWETCTGSEFSSCCIPSEGDICQDNGLCYYPLVDQVYRGTCTDRTWNDPSCPSNICVNSMYLLFPTFRISKKPRWNESTLMKILRYATKQLGSGSLNVDHLTFNAAPSKMTFTQQQVAPATLPPRQRG